jgi:hypothetical protein
MTQRQGEALAAVDTAGALPQALERMCVMKRFLLIAVLAVACLGVLAAPALAAGQTASPVHVAYVSPPAPPHGSKLVMDIHFLDLCGEDSGNVGYWAFIPWVLTDVRVWQLPDDSFYSIETMDGTWTTYPGVPSSQCDPTSGLPEEQARGSGTVDGWVTWTFEGQVIPGLRRFGWKAPVDEGGSPTDVQKGWYDSPAGTQHGNTGPWWFWYTGYFFDANGKPIDPSATPNWGSLWEVYRYRNQALYYGDAGTVGNIVVTK